MRVRTLAAATAAVLAVAGLAGCKSNVGTAATVDGQRISESDVSRYITPSAQPVTEKNADGTTRLVSPRSFVLAQLIDERLGFRILQKIPSISATTEAQLDAKLKNDIGNKSVKSVAESLGLKGYPTDFYQIVLRVQELRSVIQNAAQAGADLQKILTGLDFPVTVDPRYGSWNQKQLFFDDTPKAPSYLKLQPGGASPANQ